MSSPPSFQRLSYASSLCTLRYTGPISGTTGTWLGVEWDNPSQGKHSGTHSGIQYFTCLSPSPTSGSFIRPTRPRDQPQSFLDALREKYVANVSDADADALPKNLIYFNGKLAEKVGFEKVAAQQAQLDRLRVVALDGMLVAGLTGEGGEEVGDGEWERLVEEVRGTCGSIVELDLSRNLIVSWGLVAGVCLGLPKLRKLTLDGNRFRSGADARLEQCWRAFERIEELSLEGMLLSWDEIGSILELFPALKVLSLASNNLHAPFPSLPTSNLTSLNLSFNPISTFISISPLAELPHLSSLTLRSCSFSSLTLIPRSFKSLHHLDLVSNEISTLLDLNTIPPSFSALTSLRCSVNPFYTALPIEEAFMLTLARIPSITMLNFSYISAKERENAELYYLSRIRAEITTENIASITTLRERHLQLDCLASKHGQTEDIAAAIQYQQQHGDSDAPLINPNSLGARLVELSLHKTQNQSESAAEGVTESGTKGSFIMIIPMSTSIYRLKSLVGRKINILPRKFRLVWETGELDPVGRNIKNPGRVGEGAKIADAESEVEEEVENGSRSREEAVSWVRREVELEESTRSLGYWIDKRRAKVRIEAIRD